MRLLQCSQNGVFSAPIDFTNRQLPPYAILSHTWAPDNSEEVTFDDLERRTGESKPGYEKLRFCEKQAQRDGLQHFWIDTCCIDKENKAELSLAIRSMFRWYRNAARCYVYLSDVSGRACEPNEEADAELSQWEADFGKSRWFTRGWTLQELLAPDSVEFFSQEGQRLGDKLSLIREVHLATGIPHSALQGALLSDFSVHERISWNEHRATKLPVDRAYSLMGILGVSMPPFDGEGPAEALKRLTNEVDKQSRCLRDLYITDPSDDKKRIEETKGGLLADSYRWVLENASFQQWRNDQQNQLLWIKGDPGKGKTMLLCGIINELRHSIPKTALLSYFFCQATDSRINNAIGVLRGLLYMLVNQQPLLVSHIYKKYDRAGKAMFEDTNAWEALTGIFADLLRDPNLNTTYLIVDALDECVADLPKLLSFIAEHSSTSPHAKWIISSRNWPDIEEKLERAGHKVRLSLELNAQSVATAVNIFIEQKVSQLAEQKKYDESTRAAVLKHLTSNADNTFLWVALVCQVLKTTPKRNVLKKLSSFPPGLDSLYKRMMQHVGETDDADICMSVLASVAILYRPVAIHELVALVEQLEDFIDDLDSVREIISLCGSFLTPRESIVYFVHQSAKDFIFAQALNEVFPNGSEAVHRAVVSRSLEILSRTLHRDMYNLEEPGFSIEDVAPPEPDPLVISRYPCLYWIDHLCNSDPEPSVICNLQIEEAVDGFLRGKYVYWLEALSLCKSMAKGVMSMTKLWSHIQTLQIGNRVTELVQDAWRFIMYHKGAIENYPLQTYASALLFTPTGSLIRTQFQHEEPRSITMKPAMRSDWSACLQTLESHSESVWYVAFSHDSTRLASAARDRTVKIWSVNSGECLHTLDHKHGVTSVAFSYDSTRLASWSGGDIVKVWDTSSGECLHIFERPSSHPNPIAFSHDLTLLTMPSNNSAVQVFGVNSGECLHTLEGHNSSIQRVAFSHDSTLLASASTDGTIRIWEVDSEKCLMTLDCDMINLTALCFSPNSTKLVSTSHEGGMRIWDISSGICQITFDGFGPQSSAAFSHDSARLAAGSDGNAIRIWESSSGACLQTFEGHSSAVLSVNFSNDSSRIASGSRDNTIKIWDANSKETFQVEPSNEFELLELSPNSKWLALRFTWCDYVDLWDVNNDTFVYRFETQYRVGSTLFSPNSKLLAIVYGHRCVDIWDVANRQCLQSLGLRRDQNTLAFSPNSSMVASVSERGAISIWDIESGERMQIFQSQNRYIDHLVFSPNSAFLVSVSSSEDRPVKIWDVHSGDCKHTLRGHGQSSPAVVFSPNSILLALWSGEQSIKIWDVESGECLRTLKGHSTFVTALAFSPNSTLLASTLFDSTINVWDVDSGECLAALDPDKLLERISFDPTGEYLNTEIGVIDINKSLSLGVVGSVPGFQEPLYEGMAISGNGEWITFDSRKLLWLPSEYRPAGSVVLRNKIIIGDGSRRVWTYRTGPACDIDAI